MHTSDFCETVGYIGLCAVSNATYRSLAGSNKSLLQQDWKNGRSFLCVSGICVWYVKNVSVKERLKNCSRLKKYMILNWILDPGGNALKDGLGTIGEILIWTIYEIA